MVGKYWDTVKVLDGQGPQSARLDTRTASAKDAAVTVARLRTLLKELKVAVASKSESSTIEPPSDAKVGQVYRLQHADPGDTSSDLVPGWGYMDAFHYTGSDDTRWELFVEDGQLTASQKAQ